MINNILHDYEIANWTLTNSSAGLVYHQISVSDYALRIRQEIKKGKFDYEEPHEIN